MADETCPNSSATDDTCAVCLNELSARGEIGVPESCESTGHCFCFLCIREWARVTNTCPIDRRPFETILLKNSKNGPVIMRVPAPRRRRNGAVDENDEVDLAENDDLTACEVCGATDHEDTMLLCDGCDLGYHMACLNPPLAQVPRGEWFCAECRVDNEPLAQRLRQQRGHDNVAAPARLLGRTEQAERVRQRVRHLMEIDGSEDESDGSDSESSVERVRNASSSDQDAAASDDENMELDDDVPGPSAAPEVRFYCPAKGSWL